MERDYLDHLVELSKNADPEFADAWKEVEVELRLADLRKAASMTQEDVAAKLGVARPRVAEIERNPLSVSFGRLREYARAIGADIRIIVPEEAPVKKAS